MPRNRLPVFGGYAAWFGGPPKVSDPDDPGPDPDERGGCEPPGCVAPFY